MTSSSKPTTPAWTSCQDWIDPIARLLLPVRSPDTTGSATIRTDTAAHPGSGQAVREAKGEMSESMDQSGYRSLDSGRVHLVVSTHTTRHLGACLGALALQTRLPDSVTVTCDTDDESIGALLRSIWPKVIAKVRDRAEINPPPLFQVFREHQGEPRLNQVRNNGLRALDGAGMLEDSDLIVVIDGDILLEEHAIARHAVLAAKGAEFILPFRINLTKQMTLGISEASLLGAQALGGNFVRSLATVDDLSTLRRRAGRYRRQLAARRLPRWLKLVKAHKPKPLGGHHALTVAVMRKINGYDEGYVGYGYDDDDLGRRLHTLPRRPVVAIAVEQILAFHLHHPTRAPASPTNAPGYARFIAPGWSSYAEHGWQNPAFQPVPTVRDIELIEAGREIVAEVKQ